MPRLTIRGTLSAQIRWQTTFFLDTDTFSYTDIRNALLARVDSNDANPGDDAAFTGALPATDPRGHSRKHRPLDLSRGQEKLLGLGGVAADAGNAQTDPDTGITLNSAFPFDFDRSDGIGAGLTDAFGVIAHELTEVVMGRFMFGGAVFNDSSGNPTPFNNYSLMDLLHFISAANGGPGRAIFETGANNIISFTGTQGDPNFNLVLDNSGDIADPSNAASPRNSFADRPSDVINAITQTDLRILDALGWTRVHGLDDHNQSNTPSTTVLNINNGINGSIELQGDHDWFKVVLDPTNTMPLVSKGPPRATARSPIRSLPFTAAPTRAVTPPLRLLTADNGGVGTNSLLLTGFGNSGTFFVDVGSIGTAPESVVGKVQDIGTGTYRVTLFGNAAPVLSADADSPHALTELPGTTNSSTPDTVSGALSFTDPDVGDTHTASASLNSEFWSDGVTPSATDTALTSAMSASISADGTAGSLAWQFSLADSNVDFLAVNETLTAIYDVTVTDHHAGSPLSDSSTQQVTVVFTGTNDLPGIDASSVLANSTSELPNVTDSSAIEFDSPRYRCLHRSRPQRSAYRHAQYCGRDRDLAGCNA